MKLPIQISVNENLCQDRESCGFVVPSKLRRIQIVQIDLLAQFFSVCRKYGIHAQMFAGTLLGAVRHQGMIPWDDDVDVCMTLTEFQKLRKIASQEFKGPYFFQDGISDPGCFFGFARLRNSLTTGYINKFNVPGYNQGIYLDIFVMNALPRYAALDKVKKIILRVMSRMIREKMSMKGPQKNCIYSKVMSIFRPIAKMCSLRFLYALFYRATNLFSSFSDFCCMDYIDFCDSTRKKYSITIDELSESVMLAFEGFRFPAPKNYEAILKRIYGDYMKLPPIEQRGKWHEGEVVFNPDMPYADYVKCAK